MLKFMGFDYINPKILGFNGILIDLEPIIHIVPMYICKSLYVYYYSGRHISCYLGDKKYTWTEER